MTSQLTNYETAGEVVIDSKPYRLLRQPSSKLSYSTTYINEPPWQGVAPPMVSIAQDSWHWGAFKSQEGIANTFEYGQNTDTRFPYRLLPAPKIHAVAVGGVAAPITKIIYALGYIWVIRGGLNLGLYRIDPTTLTVTLSKTFPGTFGPQDMLLWENGIIYLTTGEAVNPLWKLAAADIILGGPDTWHQTADTNVLRLAAGINRLFGINSIGKLRNVSTGLDPMVNANWADSVQVGSLPPPVSLIPYERSVIVGSQEGYFSVGEEGFGVPLIKRIVPSFINGLNPCNFDPWLLLPHWRGLYRWQPGIVQACGMETELINQSPVHGFMSAVVSEGEWVYALVDDNSTTYLLAARERRSGEQGFGPLTWHTLLYWASTQSRNGALLVNTSTLNETRLYFSFGNDLGYITLGTNSAIPLDITSDPAANGFCYTNKYRFADWGQKSFAKVSIACKNVDANNYWAIGYSVDGGAWQLTDADGNAMTVTSSGVKTFWLPESAVGTEIQFQLGFACNGTKLPEVDYFEPFATPIPRQTPIIKFRLALSENTGYVAGIDTRSSANQFDDLQLLASQAQPIRVSGPWGENQSGLIRSLTRVDGLQEGNMDQLQIVDVELQRRTTV